MGYKLFIDDERHPVGDAWVVVRTSISAINYMKEFGIPSYISFDHDLGGNDTAMRVVIWLIDSFLDGTIFFPDDFDFYVHSQNPVGAKNIRDTMTGFLQSEVFGE